MSGTNKAPKLAEIAARIAAHLRRFEASPPANGEPSMFLRPTARANGRCVDVFYQWACRQSTLNKANALGYLAWLDAGGVGRHWEWERAANAAPLTDADMLARERARIMKERAR